MEKKPDSTQVFSDLKVLTNEQQVVATNVQDRKDWASYVGLVSVHPTCRACLEALIFENKPHGPVPCG